MRSSLHIQEVVSGHTLESKQSPELQTFATSLSEKVQSLLGQEAQEEFLKTPANVAPLFLRSQIASHDAKLARGSDWQQQAQLTVRQAGTLSGSLAILYGEEPAELDAQDCLTVVEMCRSDQRTPASILGSGFCKEILECLSCRYERFHNPAHCG